MQQQTRTALKVKNTRPGGKAPGPRLTGIDALRGVAVLLMMEQHLGLWLWHDYYRLFQDPFMLCFNGLGGIAAPLFILLAGVGSTLLVRRHPRPYPTLMVRGLVIMAFGYLLNVCVPSWFVPGSWYVLHMIGFALLLSPLLLRLPTPALALMIAAVLAVTLGVQNWLQTPLKMGNMRMNNTALPGGITRLALAEGHFPMLPWLCLFIAGIMSGRWLTQKRFSPLLWLAGISLGAAAGLAACRFLGAAFAARGPLMRACTLPPQFYPALAPMTLLLMGLAVLCTAAFHRLDERRQFNPASALVCLGRTSLTLLIVHTIAFKELAHVFHFWQILSKGATLTSIAFILTAAALLSVLWRRVGYRFGAEWLVRKVAG